MTKIWFYRKIRVGTGYGLRRLPSAMRIFACLRGFFLGMGPQPHTAAVASSGLRRKLFLSPRRLRAKYTQRTSLAAYALGVFRPCGGLAGRIHPPSLSMRPLRLPHGWCRIYANETLSF